jgi:hypothetical protein
LITNANLHKNQFNPIVTDQIGGSCEIRTHERLTTLPVFKTGAFNRSAKLPRVSKMPTGADYTQARPDLIECGRMHLKNPDKSSFSRPVTWGKNRSPLDSQPYNQFYFVPTGGIERHGNDQ